MLKIKDTYINLKNVLYIETNQQEPNCYNNFTREYSIKFIFGENYSYSSIPFKDSGGYLRTHESSNSEKVYKKFYFENEEELNEVLKELEKVEG